MDTPIAGLKETFIALKVYIRKEESSHTSDLSSPYETRKKKQMDQIKQKKGKHKEKNINVISKRKNRKSMGKKFFFEKIDKNDKPQARLNKDKREKMQAANVRTKRGHFSIDQSFRH